MKHKFIFGNIASLGIILILSQILPANSAPIVFHCSESAGPGEVISLQGAKFGAGAQVGFHRVVSSDASLAPDSSLLTPLYSTDQAITVRLPQAMPMGLYALWVKDSGGALSPVVYVNRARATGFEYAEIPAGYPFRIFGRNLCAPGASPQVKLVAGGTTYSAVVVTNTNIGTTTVNDSNVLRVTAPSVIPTGTYTVQVTNGYSGTTGTSFDLTNAVQTIEIRTSGSDVFGLGVPWGSDYGPLAANPISVTAYGADPTGVSNSVNAIQRAIYDASINPTGGVVLLPSGTFMMDHATEASSFTASNGHVFNQPANTELVVPSNVVLRGSGTSQTVILDMTGSMPYPNRAIVEVGAAQSLCGLLDFTYRQSGTAGGTPQIVLAGSKACFSNLYLSFAHSAPPNATGGYFGAVNNASHDTIIQNVTLEYGSFEGQTGLGSSNIVIRNCNFSHHGGYKSTRMLIGGGKNLLFENNVCSRDGQWPGPHAGDNAYEQGQLECDSASYITILNNVFSATNTPLDSNFGSGESINSQGQPVPGVDSGTATSVTTTSLTDVTRAWPTNALAGQTVTITGGTIGSQSSTVLSNTGTTINITPQKAWTVQSGTTVYRYSVEVNSYDFGTVTGASATTLTGSSANSANVTYWPTAGKGLAGQVVAIVSGTGAGQWRTIASNTVNTLTVTQPWDLIPSTDCHYAITGGMADHYLIKNNIFSDQPRGVVLYTGSHDCTVVGNRLANTGMALYLRSDQRNLLAVTNVGNVWYGRMNLSWDDQVADNVSVDSKGTYWPSMIGTAAYTNNNTSFGEMDIGNDFRRNVLYSQWPNELDPSSLKEGYNALGYTHVFADSILPVTTTVFEDNACINTSGSNTNYPSYVNMDSYVTAIHNQLNSGYFTLSPKPYAENYPVESTGTSVGTTWTYEALCLQADFSGTGISTGAASDTVKIGAMGSLYSGVSSNSATISGALPLASTSGSYLECVTGTSGGATGHVVIAPISNRSSWGRIFDGRSGKWLVNGAFDFFWRPTDTVTASNAMRPIDVNNGANGLRIVFCNSGGGLTFQVITGTGGGGVNLTSTPQTFMGGTTYHIGVTFSTNPATGVTTEQMFLVQGTGAITTSSTTNRIGSTTFTLNPAVLTNVSGFLGNGSWNFGDFYGNANVNMNDYDGLRLYSVDPGSFGAL